MVSTTNGMRIRCPACFPAQSSISENIKTNDYLCDLYRNIVEKEKDQEVIIIDEPKESKPLHLGNSRDKILERVRDIAANRKKKGKK
jgi:hypothetical protein